LERDWSDLTYLLSGSPRQQEAYRAIHELGVTVALARYRPVLAGTIPLGLDGPASDLDLICAATDLDAFADHVRGLYGCRDVFYLSRKLKDGEPSVIARLVSHGWPVEIFAQSRPPDEQRAVRHLDIEARLLRLGGPPLLRMVRAWRVAGWKTEPAFARVLGLAGDPYRALLGLESATDPTLAALIARSARPGRV
jgi:hypothetical protein